MNKKLKLMKPPHPGQFIGEELWELVLSVDSAAEVLGVAEAFAAVLTRDLDRCAAFERESMAILAELTALTAGGGLQEMRT